MSKPIAEDCEAISQARSYQLAYDYALQAVTELRRTFNEFAENDPYEAGKVERWDLSADVVQKEPVVQAMAATFSLILNRRGQVVEDFDVSLLHRNALRDGLHKIRVAALLHMFETNAPEETHTEDDKAPSA